MTTKEQVKDFKKYFEANLLDSNNIHTESKNTMLSAQYVYEVVSEYLPTLIAKARIDELEKLHHFEPEEKGMSWEGIISYRIYQLKEGQHHE